MSETMETTEAETKVDFEHYVQATKEIVESFRDELAEHTAELTRYDIQTDKAPVGGGRSGLSVTETKASADPQRHAELHRIRVACDNFINALSGNY
jgi:hypothetical protein